MSAPEELLALAVEAAREAGALLLERFGGPATGVSSKSSATDLVSDADRDAERLILDRLRSARPADRILSEEAGHAAGTGLGWSVDPLDGTINYLWGIPHWCVSVAVEDELGALVGVVLDPCRGELFTAIRGRGAWVDDQALTLDPEWDLDRTLLGVGFSYDREERARQARVVSRLVPVVRDVRRFGAAALDLAWLAAGRLDAFAETQLNPWDWAAGALVAREAGAELRPLADRHGDAVGLLAARASLLDPLSRLVEEALAPGLD